MPSHLRVVPPGQRSGVKYCLVQVSVMLRNSVLDDCLLCFPLVSAVVSAVLYSHLRTAKCWDNTFGVFALCQVGCPLFAPPGAVPVVGGYLYPSVLRSPGVTPQECRAAHGPLHPAVTNPPRLCWFCIRFLLSFSGMDVGYSVWCFFVSGVGLLSGFFAFQDLTLVCPDVCGPLSLSLCSVYSSATFFSLSFSLSGAGETQTPLGVWVSPCVSSSWPSTPPSTRTSCSAYTPRHRSRTCFFSFFFVSSFVVVARWYGGGRLCFC